MERIKALFKNQWAVVAAAVLTGIAADKTAEAIHSTSPAEARKLIAASPLGKHGTIEFVPLSGKATQTGLVVLNDREDYADEQTVSVVYSAGKFPQYPTPKSLIGKKLTVTGKTARYKERPQLIADSITVND